MTLGLRRTVFLDGERRPTHGSNGGVADRPPVPGGVACLARTQAA
jgi:hypothetical protein